MVLASLATDVLQLFVSVPLKKGFSLDFESTVKVRMFFAIPYFRAPVLQFPTNTILF